MYTTRNVISDVGIKVYATTQYKSIMRVILLTEPSVIIIFLGLIWDFVQNPWMIEIILVFQIVGDMTGQQEHITKQEWVGSDSAYEVKVNVLHI